MSDTTTDQPADDDTDEQPPEVEGATVEYADPEDDEATGGGDLVQLVRTGWVRFVIAGHGRVRLRPPRFGELRRLMESYEEMVDGMQEQSHALQAVAERMRAELDALPEDIDPEEKHKRLAAVTLQSRKAQRDHVRWREDHYLAWWREVHAVLGVSGEQFPDDDGLPLWLADAGLAAAVLQHWRSVPLDRGKR